MQDRFFVLDPYHVFLAAAGLALLLAHWLPRRTLRQPPSSSALLMLLGLLTFGFLPGMPEVLDPRLAPRVWEMTSELVVIVVLFATGLRLDDIRGWRRWDPTIRLLLVAMPLTIASVAVLGWSLAGMTVAGAVLLGAALAPTDPVLAGDVQVGPPNEGGEHTVRYTLTTEAGLNDGLAFPFVYMGLLMATAGTDPSLWLGEWLWRDVLYRIVVGAAVGAAAGWMLGRALFSGRPSEKLADTGPGVVALAGVVLSYGVVELVEGYGFIGAFTAGVVCRRLEAHHEFHRRLHGFSEAIEQALTALLLLLLGGTLPMLWPALDWRHALIGLGLLLVVRPLVACLALTGTHLPRRERWTVAFFGVRGIGSVYYLSYAAGHVEFINEGQLWALVVFTVFASCLLHGLTARVFVS